ncbi:MAG: hypothetical protein JW959_08345 [Pirellulales bacterium]|nr:hypothetical protein [Pirellulales bacterium]
MPKKPKRRVRKTPKRPAPADADAPHWLVDDGRWINMPENMQQTVARILVPAYRSFVLDADDELERSVGMTLVHLMWLEMAAQVELGKIVADPNSPEAILNNPEGLIERHLRLTASKCQTAELLMKLKALDKMFSHPSFSSAAQTRVIDVRAENDRMIGACKHAPYAGDA